MNKNIKYAGQGLLYVLMTLVILGAFLYAGFVKGLEGLTRILYFHVPMSWIAVLAFLLAAYYSIQYLRKRELVYDLYAEAINQLGIMFAILATITGAIWAKASWGAYWNWDPRETSIFILLLIYGAYFSLRSAIEQPDKKARLAAVYSLLAFVTVPFFIFILPRLYESLHPDPIISQKFTIKKGGMTGRIRLVFFSSLAAFTVIFFWMMHLKKSIINLNLKFKKMIDKEN